MPIKQTIPYNHGTFFITFTCHKWMNLIETVKGYDLIYNWFDILKTKGHYIHGYVIMPNHVHALISFIEVEQTINTIIGNGKRFIAYEIIKRLRCQSETQILKQLSDHVHYTRKLKCQKHEVWERSFDWKECNNAHFINQKLDYIHTNPCSGKWSLCSNPAEYIHSSAGFYIDNIQGIYSITNVAEIDDIEFNNSGQ